MILIISFFFHSCEDKEKENLIDPSLNDSMKLFKDINFNDGKYSLVFVDVKGGISEYSDNDFTDSRNFIVDSRIYYVIESTSTLNKIKDSWNCSVTNEMSDCWYDYFIYLSSNDSIIYNMRVNFKCEELILNGKPFRFDSTYVTDFIDEAKPLYKIFYRFRNNKQQARDFWDKAEKDTLIILKSFSKPLWVNFDGKFKIKYLDNKNLEREEVIQHLKKIIEEKYPNEKFELDFALMGSGPENSTEYWEYIICNKSLYNKFDLFEVNSEWIEFEDFNVEIYRKKIPNH